MWLAPCKSRQEPSSADVGALQAARGGINTNCVSPDRTIIGRFSSSAQVSRTFRYCSPESIGADRNKDCDASQRNQQMQVKLQPSEQGLNGLSSEKPNRSYQDAPNERSNRIQYDKSTRRNA